MDGDPALHLGDTGFGRVGTLVGNGNGLALHMEAVCVVLRTLFLFNAVDARQVMPAGLHGPDGVALIVEGAFGIHAAAGINEHRLPFMIDDNVADIVVVVAYPIVSALGSVEPVTFPQVCALQVWQNVHRLVGKFPCLIHGICINERKQHGFDAAVRL